MAPHDRYHRGARKGLLLPLDELPSVGVVKGIKAFRHACVDLLASGVDLPSFLSHQKVVQMGLTDIKQQVNARLSALDHNPQKKRRGMAGLRFGDILEINKVNECWTMSYFKEDARVWFASAFTHQEKMPEVIEYHSSVEGRLRGKFKTGFNYHVSD